MLMVCGYTCTCVHSALGRRLAQVDDLHVVTGGFNGVGSTVAQAYDAERRKRKLATTHLWHVLPAHDDQDRSERGPQRPDKTFAPCSSGETLFCGESVRQREDIVAQVFPVCVLIEGVYIRRVLVIFEFFLTRQIIDIAC